MKITSLNQVLDLYKQKNIKKDKVDSPNQKYDEVSISNEAYEKLNKTENTSFEEQLKSIDMGKLIDEVSDIDHEKVAKLKSQIASGSYKVDAYKIADGIISDDI